MNEEAIIDTQIDLILHGLLPRAAPAAARRKARAS
jgi:hypothetical protein